MSRRFDPMESLAATRHEFGEHGGVNLSIEASTTFTVMDPETLPELFQGRRGPEAGCYLYGRHYNPTIQVLATEIAALEGTETAYCTSSGMSAIAAVLLQLCDSGDRIVSGRTIYGGTFALLRHFLPRKAGIETVLVDEADLNAIERELRAGARVLYVETMANPTLQVANIPALAELAHAHGARLVVDNTFCPCVVSPALHGADVVVHSLTKFVNGASDIIGGAICGPRQLMDDLMDLHLGSLMILGPTPDPRVAFDIAMRLPSLGLRMAEHGRRALYLAERLRDRGLRVIYPGLPEHPDHELLNRLRNPGYGHGGVLCLDMETADRGNALLEHLQNESHFGYVAVSLGYFDTLMSLSAASTSSEMSGEELSSAGVSPGLVRMSIGYTGSLEQRWEQLAASLEAVGV